MKIKKRLMSALLAVILLATVMSLLLMTATSADSPTADAPPQGNFRLGDVDGDGLLTFNDAMQILRTLVGLRSVLDTCEDARIAANITGSNDPVEDAVAILRLLDGISSRLEGWSEDEITNVYIPVPLRMRGVICTSMRAVHYYSVDPIPRGEVFSFAMNVAPNTIRDYGTPPTTGSGFGNGFHNGFRSSFSIAAPSGTRVHSQRIINPEITPADFTLDPHHDDDAIVWAFCDCYYRGGAFGFGRVTDSEDSPSTADALEILRYIMGLPSVISDCDNARMAANITRPGLGEPVAEDAIAILRFLSGMASGLD